MSKNFIKQCLVGMSNIFEMPRKFIKKEREIDLLGYFTIIEKDINFAFQEIKREYERK